MVGEGSEAAFWEWIALITQEPKWDRARRRDLAPPEYGGRAGNFLITLPWYRPRGSDDMPPAADDIQHPRVLMIYNTAGVDDIHAVRDDIHAVRDDIWTPNAVSFFVFGILLFFCLSPSCFPMPDFRFQPPSFVFLISILCFSFVFTLWIEIANL